MCSIKKQTVCDYAHIWITIVVLWISCLLIVFELLTFGISAVGLRSSLAEYMKY